MSISTKKGDTGYTSLVGGERVSKYHSITETMGTLDEANSFLGLARASAKDDEVKGIILQIQKHLFIIGAEVSNLKEGSRPPKRTISEIDVSWLDDLVEKYEKAAAIPPEFVAFGQRETSSHMDIARTIVRKAERMIVKVKSEGMIGNDYILKYLNRLSDLIFLLAYFEEREGKAETTRTYFPFQLANLFSRKWAIFMGSIILSLIAAIIYCSAIHCKHMI
jgi:cob(I)alamin adenosyltransferase